MTEGSPTVKVPLTVQELELIKAHLWAKRIYIPYDAKWGHVFWEPYMEGMLNKVEAALLEIADI